MKSIHIYLLALSVGFLAACGSSDEPDTPENPTTETPETPETPENTGEPVGVVQFIGKSLTKGYNHAGIFNVSSANVNWNDGNVTGTIVIDMASLDVTPEWESAEDVKKLRGHLTSEDFFNTGNYPTATITINSVEEYQGEFDVAEHYASLTSNVSGAATHMVSATLNYQGEDYPISFPANISQDEDHLHVAAAFEMDRTEVGMRFMSDTEQTVEPLIGVGFNLSL